MCSQRNHINQNYFCHLYKLIEVIFDSILKTKKWKTMTEGKIRKLLRQESMRMTSSVVKLGPIFKIICPKSSLSRITFFSVRTC